jgi:hypothetical protein
LWVVVNALKSAWWWTQIVVVAVLCVIAAVAFVAIIWTILFGHPGLLDSLCPLGSDRCYYSF